MIGVPRGLCLVGSLWTVPALHLSMEDKTMTSEEVQSSENIQILTENLGNLVMEPWDSTGANGNFYFFNGRKDPEKSASWKIDSANENRFSLFDEDENY